MSPVYQGENKRSLQGITVYEEEEEEEEAVALIINARNRFHLSLRRKNCQESIRVPRVND